MTEDEISPKRTRPGRQALFSNGSAPEMSTPAAEGKRALFSDPSPVAAHAPTPGRRTGPEPVPDRTNAVIHCRTCLAATRVSIASLGISLLPSVWMPTRPYPRLLKCPACHHRSWCRIEWPRLR